MTTPRTDMGNIAPSDEKAVWKIGPVSIHGKTFLAPLAGITNLPFRRLVKECGTAVVCSEMISAKGLFTIRKNPFPAVILSGRTAIIRSDFRRGTGYHGQGRL